MSDLVVVDASLAIKWVLPEPDSHTARVLLNEWTDSGKEMAAPALFAYEVTNIIYRRIGLKLMAYEEAMQALTELFSIGISLNFSHYESISIQAMILAHRFHTPAVYDSHYLALAAHENCEYWTADIRLWNTVKGKLGWVRWFGDYEKP